MSANTSFSVRVAANRDEVAAHAVVLDQRLGLAVVVVEPALDRLVGVVGASFDLGAKAKPLEGDLVRNLQRECDVEAAADVRNIESSASA